MSKVTFTFKEDTYTFSELLKAHLTDKNLYKDGTVVNCETGEEFEIDKIEEVREKYYEYLDYIKNTLSEERTSLDVWTINQNRKNKRIKELNSKYDKYTISVDELNELIKLEGDIKIEGDVQIKLNRDGEIFYKKYQSYIYPCSLSHADIGKFHLLLDFMTYKSEIKRTPRDNSNHPKLEELMTYMRISDIRTLNRSLSKLKKNKLINEELIESKRIIYINPIYVVKNLKITPTTYKFFKEDINKFLTEKEIRYLEMVTYDDKDAGVITLENSLEQKLS